MGRKSGSGRTRRGGVWYVNKWLGGRRVRQSTGTTRRQEAEALLARWIDEERQATHFGIRPTRTFEEAAARFSLEHQHKRTIIDDANRLKGLLPWIGSMPLDQIHMGTLQTWIDHRLAEGRSAGTINHGLQVVRRNITRQA